MSEPKRLGKLKKPYPVTYCAADHCRQELGDEAYLHRDLDTDKLVTFCGDCSLYVELNSRRFPVVAL